MNSLTVLLRNRIFTGTFVALIWIAIPFAVMAQEAASSPPSADYVSRSEYDKLKSEHEAMKQELEALKTAVREMANGTLPAIPAEGPRTASKQPEAKQVVSGPAPEVANDESRQEVETLKTEVKETFPGSTKF